MPTPKKITAKQAKQWVGKFVSIRMLNGSAVHGRLVAVRGNRLMLRTENKGAQTKALLPLVLYDIAALGAYGAYGPYSYGAAPYGFGGGYGPYGFGGYGPQGYGGYGPYGFGGAPFF